MATKKNIKVRDLKPKKDAKGGGGASLDGGGNLSGGGAASGGGNLSGGGAASGGGNLSGKGGYLSGTGKGQG